MSLSSTAQASQPHSSSPHSSAASSSRPTWSSAPLNDTLHPPGGDTNATTPDSGQKSRASYQWRLDDGPRRDGGWAGSIRRSLGSKKGKGSGGFLLDTTIGDREHQDGAVKDGRSATNAGDPVRVQRGQTYLATSRTSREPKGLAFGVAEGDVRAWNGGNGGSSGAAASRSRDEEHKANELSIGKRKGKKSYEMDIPSQRSVSTSLDNLDPDSARIVNLALNLNEARRRSGNFALSPAAYSGEASGAASPASPRPRRSTTPAGATPSAMAVGDSAHATRRHRERQHISAGPDNLSPLHDPFKQTQVSPATHSSPLSTANTLAFIDDRQDFEYHFSKSTLARAAEARKKLELAAEYRRLLEVLPPLTHLAQDSAASTTKPIEEGDLPLDAKRHPTRPYNPLQCIRNRRVRRRERQMLDPVEYGWGEINAVRAWVEQCEQAATQPSFQGNNRVHLPPFPLADLAAAKAKDAMSPASSNVGAYQKSLLHGYPQVDWSVTPEELLADAYWLEHDGRKELIEGREGVKLLRHNVPEYPTPTGRKGLRAKVRKDPARMARKNSVEGPIGRRGRGHLSAPASVDLRYRHQQRGSDGRASFDTRDRTDEGNLHRGYPRHAASGVSLSSSGSETLHTGPMTTDKAASRKRKDSLDQADNARFKRLMLEMLDREAQTGEQTGTDEASSPDGPRDVAHANTIEDGAYASGETSKRASNNPLVSKFSPMQSESGFRKQGVHSSSKERLPRHGHDPSKLGDGFDTTASNSPRLDLVRTSLDSNRGYVPSFTTSVSPPLSRRTSPTRARHGNAGSVATAKAASVASDTAPEEHDIDTYDYAIDSGIAEGLPVARESQDLQPNEPEGLIQSSLRKLPSDLSEYRDDQSGAFLSLHRSRRSESEQTKAGSSRLRGLLKNMKIDGTIRKEASKIGHFMRRRDGPVSPSVLASPSSSAGSYSPNSDEDAQHIRRRSTHDSAVHGAVPAENGGISRTSTNGTAPKYHTSNLPTFTSANASAGRGPMQSPRIGPLRSLAPPTRSAGSSVKSGHPAASQNASTLSLTTADLSRVTTNISHVSNADSQDTGLYIVGHSRGSSDPAAARAAAAAGQRKKAVLEAAAGTPGPGRRAKKLQLPVTGLSHLSPTSQRRASRRIASSDTASQQRRSASDAGSPCARRGEGDPTSRTEIARLRAWFLSSGVKAQGIVMRARTVEPVPAALLVGVDSDEAGLLMAPRSKACLVAGRVLAERTARDTQRLRAAAHELAEARAPQLAQRITALHERAAGALAPEVRALADDADALSTELLTAHTLAVQRINDRLDMVVRRRRRRLRWLRRGGYVLLEWVLLGLMWWVWLVVVIVRMLRGAVRGVWTGVRWLLWL